MAIEQATAPNQKMESQKISLEYAAPRRRRWKVTGSGAVFHTIDTRARTHKHEHATRASNYPRSSEGWPLQRSNRSRRWRLLTRIVIVTESAAQRASVDALSAGKEKKS